MNNLIGECINLGFPRQVFERALEKCILDYFLVSLPPRPFRSAFFSSLSLLTRLKYKTDKILDSLAGLPKINLSDSIWYKIFEEWNLGFLISNNDYLEKYLKLDPERLICSRLFSDLHDLLREEPIKTDFVFFPRKGVIHLGIKPFLVDKSIKGIEKFFKQGLGIKCTVTNASLFEILFFSLGSYIESQVVNPVFRNQWLLTNTDHNKNQKFVIGALKPNQIMIGSESEVKQGKIRKTEFDPVGDNKIGIFPIIRLL